MKTKIGLKTYSDLVEEFSTLIEKKANQNSNSLPTTKLIRKTIREIVLYNYLNYAFWLVLSLLAIVFVIVFRNNFLIALSASLLWVAIVWGLFFLSRSLAKIEAIDDLIENGKSIIEELDDNNANYRDAIERLMNIDNAKEKDREFLLKKCVELSEEEFSQKSNNQFSSPAARLYCSTFLTEGAGIKLNDNEITYLYSLLYKIGSSNIKNHMSTVRKMKDLSTFYDEGQNMPTRNQEELTKELRNAKKILQDALVRTESALKLLN
jgi:hypothetical protein